MNEQAGIQRVLARTATQEEAAGILGLDASTSQQRTSRALCSMQTKEPVLVLPALIVHACPLASDDCRSRAIQR